jgi:AcrR family transcriptional regulator
LPDVVKSLDLPTPPRAARSQPARDRILLAARGRFGADGFDATTIRAIAQDAGVHASMVIRYYGSKEELFAKALNFNVALPDLTTIPTEDRGTTLVRHFLQRWEDDEMGDLPALLRSAVAHGGARATLLDIFRTQVLPMIARVLPAERAQIAAALIGSQILGLALSRSVLRLEPMITLSSEMIVARVGAAIQNYLALDDDTPSDHSA